MWYAGDVSRYTCLTIYKCVELVAMLTSSTHPPEPFYHTTLRTGHYEELKKSGIDIEAYVPSATTAADEGTAEGDEGRTSMQSLHSRSGSVRVSVSGSGSGTPGSAGVVSRKRMDVPSTTTTTYTTTHPIATQNTITTSGDTSHITPPTPPTPHAIPSVVTVGKEVPVPVPAAVGGNIGECLFVFVCVSKCFYVSARVFVILFGGWCKSSSCTFVNGSCTVVSFYDHHSHNWLAHVLIC